MERKTFKLILILIILFGGSLHGSENSEIYRAYMSNNMTGWRELLDRMNSSGNKSSEYLLELVNYQYGFIAWCIGKKKKSEAEKYLRLAENNISELEKRRYNLSMINAYKAAFYGYRIGLNIFKAPLLGIRSVESARNAIRLDASNPFGYIQYGHIQYYMPSVFGGSKTEALKYFIKAKQLMEKNKNSLKENWNYINLLTTIAQTYTSLHNTEAAKDWYENILSIEPDFHWVKNKLYPQLLQSIK